MHGQPVSAPIVMATPVSMPPPGQQGMPAISQQGVQMGMPPGMQQGMPAVAASPAQPGTLTCEIEVPKGKSPGETFVASTPDGQQFDVTVPPGVDPGSTISFSYTPAAPMATATPTVVGTPIGMSGPGMHQGLPPHLMSMPAAVGSLEYGVAENEQEKQDRQQSEIGWGLYCVGWGLCLCGCGPVGPIFWFGVACRHYARPKEERAQLPREQAMATVSLFTGAVGTAIIMLLAVAMATHAVKHDRHFEYNDDEGSSNRNYYSNRGGW